VTAWYIWRPARYINGERKAPNNWVSNFTGSVWEWDEHTQEYYLHLFCPEQPDLNWENPETRKAIYKSAMEFWLERGVDGFRVDTVNMYSKGDLMRDAPVTDPGSEWQFAGYQYCNGPRMAEFLAEMNQILEKYDAMTVGECPYVTSIYELNVRHILTLYTNIKEYARHEASAGIRERKGEAAEHGVPICESTKL
jgi:oligo-1,6-glucosidase